MMKLLNLLITLGCLLLSGCNEKDATPEIEINLSVDKPLSIIDNVINVSVTQDSTIIIDYKIDAPGGIQLLKQTINGATDTISNASGQVVYTGQLAVDIPFENKKIELKWEVTDEQGESNVKSISINVEGTGFFTVDGEIQLSGNVQQGQVVTISGNGFGTGPNVILYDDFEGGNAWDPIPLDGALIGAWTAKTDTYTPRYHEYSYSGNTSFSMEDEIADEAIWGKKLAQLKARFDDAREVFISYQLTVPPGRNYPGAGTRDEWGAGSHWKMTWLMDGDDGFGHEDGKADLCVPTNGQAEALQIVGNTDKIGWVASLDELFDMDGFNRVTTWLRADPENHQTEGYTWIQWLSSKTTPAFVKEYNEPVFNGGATIPTSYQWNQLNVPGWYGNNLTNPGGVYDDIYIATGASSSARVEIGDTPEYKGCKELSIMPSVSWTDSEIKVIVKTKGNETISRKYLFIFNGENELVTEGIQIP